MKKELTTSHKEPQNMFYRVEPPFKELGKQPEQLNNSKKESEKMQKKLETPKESQVEFDKSMKVSDMSQLELETEKIFHQNKIEWLERGNIKWWSEGNLDGYFLIKSFFNERNKFKFNY